MFIQWLLAPGRSTQNLLYRPGGKTRRRPDPLRILHGEIEATCQPGDNQNTFRECKAGTHAGVRSIAKRNVGARLDAVLIFRQETLRTKGMGLIPVA